VTFARGAGLPVYGMAVGNVELASGTSFTVASRLCDILPAIRHDRRHAAVDLFADYAELNLSGATPCATPKHDSGYFSSSFPN